MTYLLDSAVCIDRARPIGAMDLCIASVAVAHHLTVVTHNVRDFGRVPGLRVEDWTTA